MERSGLERVDVGRHGSHLPLKEMTSLPFVAMDAMVNSLDFVNVTERAALAASRWMGRGERDAADGAAVETMRAELGEMEISGRIVIGEGERDEAPMLFIGEEVGKGGISRWTSPWIRSRGRIWSRTGCRIRSPSWRSPSAAGCCTRPTRT